ncbi:N-acetyltransferase 6 [Austrofundulus limnaeus]|uniref:N-acetyltransferase 6 n=1 Tax=Austrofundulus limnaeus TaxID=52670 RepID=A0A2I4AP03_AUSLI|nr:PREDICTED: N-acetyltransferase 6 [Austrofundulus limnaeus]
MSEAVTSSDELNHDPASQRQNPPEENSPIAPENPHADSGETGRTRAVPIHHRPDLLVPCADLVNSEWPRSQAARVHSLQKSCSEFPVCLVLLQGQGGEERLLGHVRLTRVVGLDGGLFVESVVVSRERRGMGFGRVLMEETERYAKRRGFSRLCLTTHDKQHFYAHLGYVLSAPVQSQGAVMALVPMAMLMRLSRASSVETNATHPPAKMDVQVSQENRDSGGASGLASSPTSRPPLPPPLSSIPTTPPLPPPPPPPPQSSEQPVVQTLTESPYRDAKGLPIFWMHKDL